MRGTEFVRVVVLVALAAAGTEPASGLRPGDEVAAWHPVHVTGPEAGTTHCPVCTYLDKPVVLAFAATAAAAGPLAERVEGLLARYEKAGVRGLVVVTAGTAADLKKLAADRKLTRVSLCLLDPDTRAKDLKRYRVAAAAATTVTVYRDYTVTAGFTDLAEKDFPKLDAAVRAAAR
jgi:hypothetical protein